MECSIKLARLCQDVELSIVDTEGDDLVMSSCFAHFGKDVQEWHSHVPVQDNIKHLHRKEEERRGEERRGEKRRGEERREEERRGEEKRGEEKRGVHVQYLDIISKQTSRNTVSLIILYYLQAFSTSSF